MNQGKNNSSYNVGSSMGLSSIETDPTLCGNNYNIGISSYADTEAMNLSINYKDAFPKIKRSIYVEAFQQDYGTLMKEFD